MMAAVLPMCLVTAAMQSCVATLARSFKEAQSYMGILILAPMLVGVLGTSIRSTTSRGCSACRCWASTCC